MAYDRYIEIGHVEGADGWGASAGAWVTEEATWAILTAEGGNENKQASKIVSKNEVVFTIRHIPGITEAKQIRYNGEVYNITYIGEEGRNKILHLRAEVKR